MRNHSAQRQHVWAGAGSGASRGQASSKLSHPCGPLPTPPVPPVPQLDIGYDSFVRTTEAKHEALVKEVLERVWAQGDIYMADYEGWWVGWQLVVGG